MDLFPLKTQVRKRNIEHISTPEHTNMTQLIWKHSKSKQKEMQHLKTTDPITLYIHKHTRLAAPPSLPAAHRLTPPTHPPHVLHME